MKLWKVWGRVEKPSGLLIRYVVGEYVEGDTAADVLATCKQFEIHPSKMRRTYREVYTRKHGRIGGLL